MSALGKEKTWNVFDVRNFVRSMPEDEICQCEWSPVWKPGKHDSDVKAVGVAWLGVYDAPIPICLEHVFYWLRHGSDTEWRVMLRNSTLHDPVFQRAIQAAMQVLQEIPQ